MGQVIHLPATPHQLHAVRRVINARACADQVSDQQRRHAVAVSFAELRQGRSPAIAIQAGYRDMRSAPALPAAGPGPEAA